MLPPPTFASPPALAVPQARPTSHDRRRVRAHVALTELSVRALLALWVGLAATSVKAQDDARTLAADAMPGVHSVPLLGVAPGIVDVAGDLDYGFTEGVLGRGDRHHRIGARLSGAVSPLPFLTIGLQLGGHYDGHHGGDSGTNDSGLLMRPRLAVRASTDVSEGLYLGLQAAALPAPTENLGDALSGSALMVDALAGTVQGPLRISGRLGFGLDGGRKAARVDTLSQNDRLALGIGDAPELRVGVGATYSLPAFLLLGELTWDIPVGAKAVPATQAPIWLRAGARLPLSTRLSLGAIVGLSPSGRPTLSATGDLVRVDPRLYAGVTLAGRLFAEESSPAAPPEIDTSQPSQPPQAVSVRGYGDQPLVGAQVSCGESTCETGSDGTCTPQPQVVAPCTLQVSAAGYAPFSEAPQAADGSATVEVTLTALPVELQGTLLDEDSKPVADATVTVMRGDRQYEAKTDSEGHFQLPGVDPGPAILRVEATGMAADEREVVLSPNPEPMVLSTHDQANAGQIRGTVRALDGTPVAASIQISPRQRTLRSDAAGEFTVDVPPGKYVVTVQAPGYRSQRREAVVESHGVTVLLIDLGTEP